MTEQKKGKKRNTDDIAHRAKNGKTRQRDASKKKTRKFKPPPAVGDYVASTPPNHNQSIHIQKPPNRRSRKASKSQLKYTHTKASKSPMQSTTKASNDSETFGFGLRQSISYDFSSDDLSLSTGDDSYCAQRDTLISPKYSALISLKKTHRNIIAEKDAVIAKKDAVIEELTQQIKQLTQQLTQQSDQQSDQQKDAVIDEKDAVIEELTQQLTQQIDQQIIAEKTHPTHSRQASRKHSVVVNFQTELTGLLDIVNGHFAFIDQQSLKVDKEIARSQSTASLESAKEKSLKQEKALLREILSNWSNMNIFLNDIILIENLLNSLYQPLQAEQSRARQSCARNISIYETKPKPLCKVQSFVELLFAESLHIDPFKKWLKRVQNKCKKQNIKIEYNSGAKVKSIERAFYKAFYVYSDDKMKGYEQMTDVLRCSLVFNNFRDIYQTFNIIKQLSTEYGGILRCKDRFNDANVSFGYRDLSINIYCPSSHARIVCEIQLHHQLLYKHKDLAHSIYTKARLFQQKDGNGAYKYAQKYLKTQNRNKIYQVASGTSDDEKQMVATNSNKHKFQSKAKEKLTEWGLEEYYDVLVKQHGYDDIADWNGLSIYQLNTMMKFKQGHSERFVRKVSVSGTNII